MTYNINMGCASSKIAKQSELKRCVEVPSFLLKKTRINSSYSISPSDFLIFDSGIEIIPN